MVPQSITLKWVVNFEVSFILPYQWAASLLLYLAVEQITKLKFQYQGLKTIGSDKNTKSLATNSGWSSSSNNGAVGNSDYAEYRNITGFSAFASGYRAFTGEFVNKSKECYW